ncbi:AraC family transcriptional regulator [Mesorhizobium sp. L-8-10]|uniref:GlxA family transcriptional regulator n=1 Tax=Mesorhizobium sp. L-8-10 TaxID=2744523 RepID=UPI00192838A0|nr:GlxA family transcriptional regulator [Mesorhizobium sp. L-8-10]BCH31557.1 AraC family transcriptional regulator [Mesorhizobium sp. L-8-10]
MDPSHPDKLKIGFILARSFTLSAFALFVDTLRLASDELDRSGRVAADWQVLGSTRNLITSSCGVSVAPTSGLIDPGQFHYIVVVGGLLNADEPIDRQTVEYLKRAAAAKVSLIGLCTGSFILAEAGLMKRHQACVSWLHVRIYRERFPDHPARSNRIFNLEGRRGSCAGGSSAADMAASIVRRFISKDAERNALEVLQIDRARPPLHVQPRRPLYEDFRDTRVKAALVNMEQNLDGGLTIEALAAKVGLSRRQLERVFQEKAGMSPAQAYARVRMGHAKLLITQTKAPMIEVALDVGFENASHFTRIFKRIHGQTPSEARAMAELAD